MSNINDKSSPNQMRILMKRMREDSPSLGSTYKPPKTTQDFIKGMRKVNFNNLVENEEKANNIETSYDQEMEKEKLLNYFKDLNVNFKFIDLEVYDNLVYWGGLVDGIIKFAYTVTADENTNGVTFDYTDEFSPDNPENEEIVNRLELYFNTFSKYWQENVIQK